MTSFNRVTMSGSTSVLPVPFPYLDKTHVQVYLNGVLQATNTYTWGTASQIVFTLMPTAGTIAEARRVTPTTPIVTFSPGNLDTTDLNVASLQPLYIAEEGRDIATDTAARGWYTAAYGIGGTITKGGVGYVPTFDASGNLIASAVVLDPVTGAGYMVKSAYDPNGVGKDAFDIRWTKGSAMSFGCKGDGVTDDTAAWAAFQAYTGLKWVPPGRYLVSGSIKRFDAGCWGNGEFNDTLAAWDQNLGDRERDSAFIHSRVINANGTLLSPTIKIQNVIDYVNNSPDPDEQFKYPISFYADMRLRGRFNTTEDRNNNFTSVASVVRNDMSGLFGSLAGLFYNSDATETENPAIITDGATKNGCIYLQPWVRSRYQYGGYGFGLEVIFLNTSADVDTDIPFLNNSTFSFTKFTASAKISCQPASAPVGAGIMLTGSTTSKHNFWNGIVVGQSCFAINNNRSGPAGTVGIHLASWRDTAAYPDIGIWIRKANRHINAIEGLKIKSLHTRFMNDEGSAGISIEGAGSNTQYLNFRQGADSSADGGSVSNVATLTASSSQFIANSIAGEIILSAVNVARVRANSARLAPVTGDTYALGSSSARWSEVWCTQSAINTSDAEVKENIEAFPDEVLDAWGTVGWVQYQMKASVAAKGADAARLHGGLIAQRIKEAFEERGLDAFRYGLLCWDEWEAEPDRVEEYEEVLVPARYEEILVKEAVWEEQVHGDETIRVMREEPVHKEGAMIDPPVTRKVQVTIPGIKAGSLYGIRYEEALSMEAAYQRRRADRMEAALASQEARLAAIEARLAA